MITVKPTGQYPAIPAFTADPTSLAVWLKNLWSSHILVWYGKTNNVFTFKADAAGATSTIIKHRLLSMQSVLAINGLTANAQALLLTAPGMYATEVNRGSNQWTLTHPANVNTDAEFIAAIIG